jgi:hypothetical protein
MCSNFQLWQSLQKVHVFLVVVVAAAAAATSQPTTTTFNQICLNFWHCATSLRLLPPSLFVCLLGPATTGLWHWIQLLEVCFTLLELVSLVKVFRVGTDVFSVLRVWAQYIDVVQHLICWQGQCVCDALFLSFPFFGKCRVVKIMCKISYFWVF